MKKGDFIWLAAFAALCAFLLTPVTQGMFMGWTKAQPYVMGFIKFGVLATMGELMALRIVTGDYKKPAGLIWRIVIWGFIGMLITLMFPVFDGGVKAAQAKHYLPFEGNLVMTAFFTSAIMNCFFAPAFMGFHKYTDTYLDLKAARKGKITIKDITKAIDWDGFISFVVLKTIPFFWIPAHTITFILAPQYRVLVAAFLSIALGAMLAFSKKQKKAA